jgi:pyruvate/2-oxoglutarate dehydrogenase complex dihydrolipoamide dehydrogenase (E3) component
VIVIGAGPAGYPAAIRRQNKLKVACIDGWKNHDGSYAFGGTCLNAGAFLQALLKSSELSPRNMSLRARHQDHRCSSMWPPCRRKNKIVKTRRRVSPVAQGAA